jgi:hypothetical protein
VLGSVAPGRQDVTLSYLGLPDYKPVSVPPFGVAVIPLGRRSLPGSSDLPGSGNGAGRSSSPIWSCSAWGLPCQRALLALRCALTAPFHPYRPRYGRRYIFCGTFRRTRFERVPPAVSRHAALWRPDFPPAPAKFPPLERATARPAGPSSIMQAWSDRSKYACLPRGQFRCHLAPLGETF